MSLSDDLAGITRLTDQRQRATSYASICERLAKSGSTDGLSALLSHLLSEDVPQVISRGVMSKFGESLHLLSPDVFEDVANAALAKLAPQVASFEEADYMIRHQLFDHYVTQNSFADAAATLAGINMETSSRAFTEAEKAEIYVKVAETYCGPSSQPCTNWKAGP